MFRNYFCRSCQTNISQHVCNDLYMFLYILYCMMFYIRPCMYFHILSCNHYSK